MVRYLHFNQTQGRTMQVTGVIQSIQSIQSKLYQGKYAQRITIDNVKYDFLTKYPDNMGIGDKITFDCKENGEYKNIDYKTLKVLEKKQPTDAGSLMGELMQYMEINFRQLNDKMDSILTKVPKKEVKPQVEEGFDDDLPF